MQAAVDWQSLGEVFSISYECVEISKVHTHTATSVYALIPLWIEVKNTSVSGAGQQIRHSASCCVVERRK